MLNIIDEFTRECLAIRVDRKLKSTDVIDVLSDLFILRGVPGHVRSDNGPEFVAKAVRDWIAAVGAKTAYIEPGSPWENGYCESFNSKLRDELLNGEIFYTSEEARVIIESWRRHYNEVRPHSSLGYRPPAPQVLIPARPAAQPRPAPPGALAGATTNPKLTFQPDHSIGAGHAQKVVASCSHLDVPEFDFPAGRSAPRISEVDQRLASARENLLSRVIWNPYSRSWCN